MLGGYGITPKQILLGDRTMKGYLQVDLNDAFQRYVPVETETAKQSMTAVALGQNQTETTERNVSVLKSQKPAASAERFDVSVSKEGTDNTLNDDEDRWPYGPQRGDS